MTHRFFAMIWDSEAPASREAATQIASALSDRRKDLIISFQKAGFAFYTSNATSNADGVRSLDAGAGLVFGTLFERNANPMDTEPHAPAHSALESTDKIVRSGGRFLLDRYWGHYLAFVFDTQSRISWVFRSPACHQPCLHVTHKGVSLYFSSTEDLARLGIVRLTVNWDFVANFIACVRPHSSETGLNEISEIQVGEYHKIDASGSSRGFHWRPGEIAQGPPMHDAVLARQALRATVKSCISTWAALHPAIVHRLSGGLDSSVIAACLSQAPTHPSVTCLNYYLRGAYGDEREYARAVVKKNGLELVEVALDGTYSLEPMLGFSRTESPSAYLYRISIDPREGALAATLGATARFTGIMGDILFQVPPALPAAVEYLQRRGFDRGFLTTAMQAAQLDRLSIWKVLRSAITKGIIRPPTTSSPGEFEGQAVAPLTAKASAAVFTDKPLRFIHPWLRDVSQVPFGKHVQIACLSFNSVYFDALQDPDESDFIHPYLSEPVMELCLRIPTYVLMHSGWDRALVREAFHAELPNLVRTRTTKGAMNLYIRDLIANNASFICDLLRNGVLVQQGILSPRKLEDALPGKATRSPLPPGLLWACVAAEAWTRVWLGASRSQRVAA